MFGLRRRPPVAARDDKAAEDLFGPLPPPPMPADPVLRPGEWEPWATAEQYGPPRLKKLAEMAAKLVMEGREEVRRHGVPVGTPSVSEGPPPTDAPTYFPPTPAMVKASAAVNRERAVAEMKGRVIESMTASASPVVSVPVTSADAAYKYDIEDWLRPHGWSLDDYTFSAEKRWVLTPREGSP